MVEFHEGGLLTAGLPARLVSISVVFPKQMFHVPFSRRSLQYVRPQQQGQWQGAVAGAGEIRGSRGGTKAGAPAVCSLQCVVCSVHSRGSGVCQTEFPSRPTDLRYDRYDRLPPYCTVL